MQVILTGQRPTSTITTSTQTDINGVLVGNGTTIGVLTAGAGIDITNGVISVSYSLAAGEDF